MILLFCLVLTYICVAHNMKKKLVRFAKSARKHRIGKSHVLHVLEHHQPTILLTLNSDETKLLWIGKDARGLELEVVAVELTEYLLVIHVMPRSFRRR